MRVAISTDHDSVSAHFGRCPSFTIVDIEDGSVAHTEALDNPGHQPGVIPQFLHERGVECIVAGGMGMRASRLFEELGIRAIAGVSGSVDEAIQKLQNGTLAGGESLCRPGSGTGYGVPKTQCDQPSQDECEH